MLEFRVRGLEQTAALGRVLAECLREAPALRCILLHGDLGSGKTTLTRFLVEALPGGDRAEISSPGFTICNLYPTTPQVLHCDLYRSGGAVPDEISETFDAVVDTAVVAEWGGYLPLALLPQDVLDIYLQVCDKYRLVRVEARGPGGALAESLLRGSQAV